MKLKKSLAYLLSGSLLLTPLSTCASINEVNAMETARTASIVKSSNIEYEPMYRVYNPNSGEHFYTASVGEKNHLVSVGWRDEGIGWYAPKSGETVVYRLYNPNAGDHLYTINNAEAGNLEQVGWKLEGVGWRSLGLEYKNLRVPVYRQYNPNAKAGSHNFTTSKAESNHLVKVGWNDEGIAWYGIDPAQFTSPKKEEEKKTNSSGTTAVPTEKEGQKEGSSKTTVTPTEEEKKDNSSKTTVSPSDSGSTKSGTADSKGQASKTDTASSKSDDTGKTSVTETPKPSPVTTETPAITAIPTTPEPTETPAPAQKEYTDHDLFGTYGFPTIPDGMTEAEYGQQLVKLHPDVFQSFYEQTQRCTTDLGKMIAVSNFIYTQGYTYEVKDRTWQESVDFFFGKNPSAQCDGIANKTFILCCIAGLPVEKLQSDQHAWNQVEIDGKWYQFDNVGLNGNCPDVRSDVGEPEGKACACWIDYGRVYKDEKITCGESQTGMSQITSNNYVIPGDENLEKQMSEDGLTSLDLSCEHKEVISAYRGHFIRHSWYDLGYSD